MLARLFGVDVIRLEEQAVDLIPLRVGLIAEQEGGWANTPENRRFELPEQYGVLPLVEFAAQKPGSLVALSPIWSVSVSFW